MCRTHFQFTKDTLCYTRHCPCAHLIFCHSGRTPRGSVRSFFDVSLMLDHCLATIEKVRTQRNVKLNTGVDAEMLKSWTVMDYCDGMSHTVPIGASSSILGQAYWLYGLRVPRHRDVDIGLVRLTSTECLCRSRKQLCLKNQIYYIFKRRHCS